MTEQVGQLSQKQGKGRRVVLMDVPQKHIVAGALGTLQAKVSILVLMDVPQKQYLLICVIGVSILVLMDVPQKHRLHQTPAQEFQSLF